MRPPRVYGIMVTKNEADRYLASSLGWHSDFVHDLFVFDDQSTDDTVDIASHYATVAVRDNDEPSFMDHEGQFRQTAWESFELHMQPLPGDWVLSIDADEFFVSGGSASSALALMVHQIRSLDGDADLGHVNAINLKIVECFGFDDLERPLVRLDGYWDTIHAPRFFRYRLGGRFASRALGCGSTPTYVRAADYYVPSDPVILHYGYVRPEDRCAKYERYANRPGHSSEHVQSILQPPTLQPWTGVIPDVY